MLTESSSRSCIYLLLLPASALVLLLLFLRHGRKAHPYYIAAFLLPFISLVSFCFQSSPTAHSLYLLLYVLGELLRAILPVPLSVKVTDATPPVLFTVTLVILAAVFLVLLPCELAFQDAAVAGARNTLRFCITWAVSGYLLARLGSVEAGLPRISVFLCGVTSLLYVPFVVVASLKGYAQSRSFFVYEQGVVDYYMRYATFNLIVALMFVFKKTKPALVAVRDGMPDILSASRSAPEDNGLLSKREWEIALLLCRGCSYKEIADRLFISLHTVRNHCHHIFEKCGANSRFELITVLGVAQPEQHAEPDRNPMAVGK
jgi:DNA-binding CsgD family transcriptional regulator